MQIIKMKQKFGISLLLLFYVILGLRYSSQQGFWLDEIYTLTFLRGVSAYDINGGTLFNTKQIFSVFYLKGFLTCDGFLKNFYSLIINEGHPPLYFLLLKCWSLIFGFSEVALRGFSLFCGTLSFVVILKTINIKFPNKKNLVFLLLIIMLLNPFLFYYFTEARMYALAFLFSSLSLLFYIRFKQNEALRFGDFICFCLSSAALLYTHYYGLFFLLTIIFYTVIKDGISLKTIKYVTPFILFAPWIIIIKIQTEVWTTHWTDGTFSFLLSAQSFKNRVIDLFFFTTYHYGRFGNIFSIIAGFFMVFYISKSWKDRLIYISVLAFYFLQIYTIDVVQNHHTINVPRYFIFLLVFFYWSITKSIVNAPKFLSFVLVFFYAIITGSVFYDLNFRSFGKKQMNKEIAAFLDSTQKADKTILVVEPGGAIIWGLAYYLKNDFCITSAKNFNTLNQKELRLSKKIVFVDNLVGYSLRKKHFNTEEKKNLKPIYFGGLVLYE